MALLLKGCPKCKGDLYLEDGDLHCLQCGYIKHQGRATIAIDSTKFQDRKYEPTYMIYRQ